MTALDAFQPKSDLVRVLLERGYLHQCTNLAGLDARAAAGVVTGYIGFDATASSLHVGSLLQIMILRRMQQTGHRPIALMGGGTTKVGDPTFKDTARPLLTDQAIAANIAGIKRAFDPFLRFGVGPTDGFMGDNADWLDRFGYVEFLREFGTEFTINRMLAFDSVKLRLEREQPMTFLEFNYMLMQAVDFLELHNRFDCALQLGGSDQWGNIVNGVELVRRKAEAEVFGFTAPLITTASGAKMGKTAEGAVWLNADLRSPYDYWQFWRNTEDADVGRFLRLFTDLPLEECARLEALQGAEINAAKKVLADEATRLLHGDQAQAQAAETARLTFEEGRTSESLPTVDLDWAGEGGFFSTRSPAALVRAAGLARSLTAARQLVPQGVWINDERVNDDTRKYSREDTLPGLGAFKVRVGRQTKLVRPI